jgi:hypothetical protein
MSGAQAAKHADTMLTGAQVEKECFYDGGEYLPLNVWGHRGFDKTRIETLSRDEDIREDAVLGTTYRVKIVTKVKSIARVHTRSTVLKRKIAALEDKPAEMLALGNASPSPPGPSSSSDSSSSSSSSSSSHKKSKKGKKGKKSKKSKKDKKDKKGKNNKTDKKDKKHKKDISNLII